jgi:hypothetical protein
MAKVNMVIISIIYIAIAIGFEPVTVQVLLLAKNQMCS